jgi:hypothetical protein
MDVKRLFVFGMLGLFLVFMMGGVLALSGEEAGKNIVGFFGVIVSWLIDFVSGAVNADGSMSEFLFFVLLAMIIYTIISSFFSDTNKYIKWVITLSISTLSVIGMPEGYLDSVLVSYGAMGLTILTIIPLFIVLLFSVKVKSLLLARATWAFYAVYYVAVVISGLIKTGVSGFIHWVAVAVGVAMFFFVPYLRNIFDKGELDKDLEKAERAINRHTQTQKLRQKSDESVVGALEP